MISKNVTYKHTDTSPLYIYHHLFHFHSFTILIHPHEVNPYDQMLRVAPPERRPLPGQSQVIMIMFDIDHHYIDKLFSCVSIVPDLTR